MTQQEFWRKQVEAQPLEQRLAYLESHFPGTYGCGWEEGIFYPLPMQDARILQSLWEETYSARFGKPPGRGKGPLPKYRKWLRENTSATERPK